MLVFPCLPSNSGIELVAVLTLASLTLKTSSKLSETPFSPILALLMPDVMLLGHWPECRIARMLSIHWKAAHLTLSLTFEVALYPHVVGLHLRAVYPRL
jgi:hypothetical protein